MKNMSFQGRWVLVTGASSGLGAEIARQLAVEHGARLILVARREERIEALAQELRQRHGTEVLTIAADLSLPAEAERITQLILSQTRLYAAILNAGSTHFGHHDEIEWDELERMLQLNVIGTTRLVHLLLPELERNSEHGGILLVASMAGLVPVAYQSAYSGTKSFLVNYGCSLHHEMRTRGVTVSTFAPGGIATEMTQGRRFNDLRGWLMPVEPCAKAALSGFKKRKYLIFPGVVMRIGAVVTRLLPQSLVVGLVASQYRKSLSRHG
jgi:uncharacterized protein